MNETFISELVRNYENRLHALEEQIQGMVTNPGRYLVERMFVKTGIADNTATSVFRITTNNESGSTDAGGYSVFVHALIGHNVTGNAAIDTAVKSFTAHFARAMEDTGAGVNSAVSEISESGSAATTSLQKDLSTVTMTVVETSEYLNDVQFTLDLTGAAVTTGQVICVVRLIYYGFTTPPTLSQL